MKTKHTGKQNLAGIGLLALGLLGGGVAIIGAIALAIAVYELGHLIHPTPIGTNVQGHVIFRVDWPRTEGHHVLPKMPVLRDINGEVGEPQPGHSR
jgi:hypothetical protein